MRTVRRTESVVGLNRFGGILLGLAFVAVAIAYPPPVTGLDPLFGIGGFFPPMIVASVSLVMAFVGGYVLVRDVADVHTKRVHRLLLESLTPVVAVTVVTVYLNATAGLLGPSTMFFVVVIPLAVFVAITNEFDR